MKPQTSSNLRWLLLFGAVAAAIAVLLVRGSADSRDTPPQPPTTDVQRVDRREKAPLETFTIDEETRAPARDVPGRVHTIDLHALREKIPDNLYWRLGEPTEDPKVLEQRAMEQRGWDELRGKVVSNTATHEEIDRYYEYRRKLSEDYIQFSEMALEQYGDQLPEHEVGGYELSIKMHSAKLAEIPKQREQALVRKIEQDKKREAWKRERQQQQK